MVRIDRIYTRHGDDGSTALVGGKRVKKNDPRVRAYGEVDELQVHLGAARDFAAEWLLGHSSTDSASDSSQKDETAKADWLQKRVAFLQNLAFDLGAELATAPEDLTEKLCVINDGHIKLLETWIDEACANLPTLTSFVLPGGSALNRALHSARVSCRRCERALLDLQDNSDLNHSAAHDPFRPELLRFLNRLSDALFAFARYASQMQSLPEHLWTPKASFS
jgi:cob(I)alamin adenosyltransferase